MNYCSILDAVNFLFQTLSVDWSFFLDVFKNRIVHIHAKIFFKLTTFARDREYEYVLLLYTFPLIKPEIRKNGLY